MHNKLSDTLGHSKQYTLAVAAAMPADGYNFKPAEEIMSFGELLNHIAYGITWWEANYINGVKTGWAPPAAGTSKEEVKTYLEKAYDNLANRISTSALQEEAVAGFHATLDHITHHRGQATIYLRCKGIQPPEYLY
ncbi:MAG: DinB family protein [Chitinophagaceae bacterium]